MGRTKCVQKVKLRVKFNLLYYNKMRRTSPGRPRPGPRHFAAWSKKLDIFGIVPVSHYL